MADTATAAAVHLEPPLCVDMDGTLLNGDSLHEALLAALARQPLTLLRLPALLAGNRAELKRDLAARAGLDPALLPYNEPLLELLRREKAAGRRLVLATAADRALAEAVADHLGLFDRVIASEGGRNLRGAAKAEALAAEFGAGGFDYAGNDATDLAVWAKARRAMVVNAPNALAARIPCPVAEVVEGRRSHGARAALKAMRPHQWSKNMLVFIPVIAAGAWGDLAGLGQALLAFLAFCLTASAIYVWNDLSDLGADRRHPRKRKRPLAHGDLPVLAGLALAPLLLLTGLGVSALAGVLPVMAAYAVLTSLYSFKLKELPLVDVFLLASLYTIRVFAGGVASGYAMSLWLLAFSCFIFLSLGFVKRVAELAPLAEAGGSRVARRGYMARDAGLLGAMGVASSFASGLVLALYVQHLAGSGLYGNPVMLWGLVPLMLFWQCRLWLSTARGYMHDDPIVYASRDWVSWVVGALCLFTLVTARLPAPFLAGQWFTF